MDAAGQARAALGRAAGLVRQHKVISSVTALFVVAAIAVSLLTSSSEPSSAAARHPAPGFSLAALGGKPGQKVSLAQYAGKPVIVNFWASWCDPCQKETPLLASWYKAQHGKVVLLGLDENDPVAAKAIKFAHAKGVTYPIGFDPNVTAASGYAVDALPQTFFLNAKHEIVDQVAGAVTAKDLAAGLKMMNAGG